ncbi:MULTISPECIES: copper chaperone PCu(A)C [Pseudomonas]|uniref:copper chaperone PCu(A)C n=1 Tax=Pseudomonas TaxID=286 RepID=UPI0004D387EB|nr:MULTISPECIES: copper chaperone PCu(A)C [Pseudomonas]MDF3866195.1 copper chaperone PCu(A)C [Pseudomonas denitrificans (nom. rej.)]KES20087.1 copper chaperone [Pseudomonas sp. AAC]MDU4251248.1 copper chaperone PCu(A)C [Pseudomonas sp.]NMZ77463.1 copper chaperone PCu(A)C [Pseudomonas nitroreducens]NNN26129.1 copper chaperone PCu(A)C [Pseudomonas nitroreducens]
MRYACTLCLPLLLTSMFAQAAIEVGDARIRILPGDLPAAGYFTLTNDSPTSVTLEGAESPAFASVMMHQSVQRDGTASMQHLMQVEIPANGKLSFAPGGYHLMLMQRQVPLAVGDKVQMTLKFSDGQRVPATFTAVLPGSD